MVRAGSEVAELAPRQTIAIRVKGIDSQGCWNIAIRVQGNGSEDSEQKLRRGALAAAASRRHRRGIAESFPSHEAVTRFVAIGRSTHGCHARRHRKCSPLRALAG